MQGIVFDSSAGSIPPADFETRASSPTNAISPLSRFIPSDFCRSRSGWVKIGEGLKNPLLLQIERWRDHIRQFIEKQSQPPCSGIFEALVLGEQGKIPDEVKETFYPHGNGPSSGHLRRSIRDRGPPLFLPLDLDSKALRISPPDDLR